MINSNDNTLKENEHFPIDKDAPEIHPVNQKMIIPGIVLMVLLFLLTVITSLISVLIIIDKYF